MIEPLRLPDMLLQAGSVQGAPALDPARTYLVVRGHLAQAGPRRCRYIAPHTRPGRWDWTGLVVIWLLDTRRLGVVRPQDLEPAVAPEQTRTPVHG